MRKLCLILLAILVFLPASAFAERGSSGDGSLVVTNASARLTVSGRGLIYGHLDRGTITVVGDYKPDNNTSLSSVSGAKMKVIGGNVVYTGADVRFLFPGGRYTLIVDATGIDISAVGAGKLSAIGKGLPDDGTFAVDGGAPQSIDVAGLVPYGKGNGNSTSSAAASAAGGNGKGKNG
jgi:hypothetical protein